MELVEPVDKSSVVSKSHNQQSSVVNTTAWYTATFVSLDTSCTPHNLLYSLPKAQPALARRDVMSLSTEMVTMLQTDGQTTCHGNTALYVASRGKKQPESANLHQVINLPSWILFEVMFHAEITICRTAKFGEDILNNGRATTSGRFPIQRFWPWTLTLTSQKLTVTLSANAEYPCHISWKLDFYFLRNHN